MLKVSQRGELEGSKGSFASGPSLDHFNACFTMGKLDQKRTFTSFNLLMIYFCFTLSPTSLWAQKNSPNP